jgi:hypothetical protein
MAVSVSRQIMEFRELWGNFFYVIYSDPGPLIRFYLGHRIKYIRVWRFGWTNAK